MSELVLLYDEDCGFCRWSVAKILAWDRGHRLRAAPLQSAEAARLLVDIDPDLRMATAHVVSPSGRVHSGGAIAEPMLRALPGGRPLAALARAMPGATEHTYRFVARHREQLGRWLDVDTCSVPSGSSGRERPT